MNKIMTRICAALLGFLLLVSVGLFTVDGCCFRRSFYESEYAKLDTAREMGMAHGDLMEATDTLLDYLKDRRDDLDLRTTVNGETVEMFDAREKAHMTDVKALYRTAMSVARIAAIAAAALALLLILFAKRHRKTALRGILAGFGVFGLLLAAAAVYAAADFYHFWRSFHELLFDNDLWQLYPDERLIQMVPQQFFSDLVMRIVAVFAGIAAVLTAADLTAQKKMK
ncbi:MAG: TIGR01906 family membrane protein [Ruminococcaceae bacterium]|nr:TIGR01906 family membrane protein [Oscillospiraceae bacterium]